MNILAARRAWWLVRCTGAIALSMHAIVALAGVELIDVGIEDPPVSPPKLFAWVLPQQEPQATFEQEWTISIEQAAIQMPADAIELNLPDRDPVIVSRMHWEARAGFIPSHEGYGGQIPNPQAEPSEFSWRWYGKSDRGYTLALTLTEGQLAGRIWAPANVHYALEPDRDTTRLGLIRPNFWNVHPPGWDDPPEGEGLQDDAQSTLKNGFGTGGSWDLTCSGPLPAGQHPVDVLVMYTPNMIDGSSSMGYTSLAAFTAAVHSAIDDANQALRNVGIFSYSYALRGIEPADSINYSQLRIDFALGEFSGIKNLDPLVAPWCTYTTNTYVSARRNTMWADVMALARAPADPLDTSCGVSKAQRHVAAYDCPRDPGSGFDPFSYLVFNPKCGADQLNLAHEFGHLLGMEHDPHNAKLSQTPNRPSCPWSYGHRRADSALPSRYHFRTVMAYYNDPSGAALPGPNSCNTPANCPQIDAYSDPLQDWHGEDNGINPPPYGLQPADPLDVALSIGELTHPTWRPSQATQTLPRLAPIVSAFRPRPDLIFANGFEP